MKNLYFIFERIPDPQSGGLITMYRRLEKLLKDDYNIKIISVFNCPQYYKNQFASECTILNNMDIDNRFFKLITHLKQRNMKAFFHCIVSAIVFFLYIPIARIKMKKIIKEEDKILVSAPAAGIFMTNKRNFILEIHSKYEFFWEESFGSKMQIKLMAKPSLILFRNKTDSLKGNKHFPSSYIYNFFDNNDIHINENYKEKNFKFLFMGRFNEDKDPIRLLKIMKELIRENKHIILDLYGQGSMEDEIKKYIKKNNLENNIFLKGFTNNKNIYSSYSALLMTSRREGFPLTIIEAKANGIPTISTKWGEAIYETITSGVDGYIANNDDEFKEDIKKLLENEKLLKKLSENAFKDFERFSTNEARKKYIEFIESV